MPLLEGSSRDYPFDVYTAFIQFAFRLDTNTSQAAIPLAIEFAGAVQSIKFRPEFAALNPDQDPFRVTMTITVLRANLTIFFCICVMILMWILAIALLCVTGQALFSPREVPPPLLAAATAMLFALPAVRNVQPNVPAIGCASDVLSFFWQVNAALSSLMPSANKYCCNLGQWQSLRAR